MAKRTFGIGAPKNKDGSTYDPTARSAGNGSSFKLVEPGYYYAVVQEVSERTDWRKFTANGKTVKNPKHKEGKWEYWSLTPHFVLVNENKTIINRQNFQLGVLDEGELVRPDKDNSRPAIWAEGQYFLAAVGGLRKEDGDDGALRVEFDPDTLCNMVVKVRTGIGGYIKGNRGFTSEEMTALLVEQNDGEPFEFEDIGALIALYNTDNELDQEGAEPLKAKNIIEAVYPVDLRVIEENGYFLDPVTGAVFVSEADYTKYLQLVDASDNYQEPDL